MKMRSKRRKTRLEKENDGIRRIDFRKFKKKATHEPPKMNIKNSLVVKEGKCSQ